MDDVMTGYPSTEMLGSLGLSDDETASYQEILRRPGITLSALAGRLDVPPPNLVPTVRRLLAKSLVAGSAEPHSRLQPLDPEIALRTLVAVRKLELHRAEVGVGSFGRTYRDRGAAGEPSMELVQGTSAVAERFREIQGSAVEEVLGFAKPPFTIPDGNAQVAVEEQALQAGVRYRVVYDPDAFGTEDAGVNTFPPEEQSRVYPVPMKLGIIDGRVGLLPHLQPDGSEALFVIRSAEFAETLGLLFEFIWDRALPMHVFVTSGNEADERRELVQLLAAGLKDEVIARRLGLSLRTVQRRISDLLRSLGVRTRFQAGVRALSEGWIDV